MNSFNRNISSIQRTSSWHSTRHRFSCPFESESSDLKAIKLFNIFSSSIDCTSRRTIIPDSCVFWHIKVVAIRRWSQQRRARAANKRTTPSVIQFSTHVVCYFYLAEDQRESHRQATLWRHVKVSKLCAISRPRIYVDTNDKFAHKCFHFLFYCVMAYRRWLIESWLRNLMLKHFLYDSSGHST